MTVLLSHSVVPFFPLTFDGPIVTLGNTNITCDCTFVTFNGFLIFFSQFDLSIVTLNNANISFNCTFVTFSSTFIFFFSHLTVLSSH